MLCWCGRQTIEGRMVTRFTVTGNSTDGWVSPICYLQMTLFYFVGPLAENVLHIRLVLMCFMIVIGLKVNLNKSELVPMGKWTMLFIWIIYFVVRWGLSLWSIWEMPLGSSYKSLTVWNVVLERLEKRLAGWKMYLSKVWLPYIT